MIKLFDYEKPKKGWFEVESEEAAKKYVASAFDEYFYMDKDNCEEYYIEMYKDGEYTVFYMECGSWLVGFRDYDEEIGERVDPYRYEAVGKREDFGKKFTELSPIKDYILIR